jgi:predicted homoserine dehydrogenase-like protein
MFGLNDRLEALDKSGNPIRVAFVGAGAMGTNFIGQTVLAPGMDPRIVVDLKIENCVKAWIQSGISENQIVECKNEKELEKALKAQKKAVTSNFDIVANREDIDVVVEATGNVNAATKIAFESIRHKKHVVSLSVEMDVVVGHILKYFADNAGVVYTGIYGDEPGVIKLLYDSVKSLGFEVVAAGRGDTGNSDLKWNPDTVKPLLQERARKRGFDPNKLTVNPYMFASFNDGSKTNEELTMVANSTGLIPDVRGTHSPLVQYSDFQVQVPKLFNLKEQGGLLTKTGVVESVGIPGGVGPIWCFVVVTTNLDSVTEGLRYHGSGGPGPNWVWYEPIHWISATAPISIAYAALYNQPTIAPVGSKRVADTITIAKKDLKAGEEIDEIGGYCVAGRIEKARVAKEQNLLPLGMAKGNIMKVDKKQGEPITCEEVEFTNKDSFVYQMRKLQDSLFDVM